MIVLIDHHDSFVFILSHYLQLLGYPVMVIRQDRVSVDEIYRLNPSHLVLSPGPCSPAEAPISIEVVQTFLGKIPIMGICLGHQIIGHVFGGKVQRAIRPMHGQSSELKHSKSGLFSGIPSPCRVGRYHSLIVSEEGLSSTLDIIARSEEQEIMAFVNAEHGIAGVQFHPESILSQYGMVLLKNFLEGVY